MLLQTNGNMSYFSHGFENHQKSTESGDWGIQINTNVLLVQLLV